MPDRFIIMPQEITGLDSFLRRERDRIGSFWKKELIAICK